MPDIIMCASKECPVRKKCYRATAKQSNHWWQSWSDFYDKESQDCEHFEGVTYEEALVEMGYTLKKEPK